MKSSFNGGKMASPSLATTMVAIIITLMPLMSKAIKIGDLRELAAKNNITCLLVFGDSSVDPGNNNYLATSMKGNFPPYGVNFFRGRPTGRFSNGRLPTDFLAEALGYTREIPAFLDPNVKPRELLHGISFASAASGYDDLTANLSSVLSVSKQIDFFKHYKLHLSRLIGKEKAEELVRYAVVIISMGTNDFLQNYYLEPVRPKQYTIQQYQNFLASRMFEDIKELHRLGITRVTVVGVPPFGCMPIVKTLNGEGNSCVARLNQVADSFNSKIKQKLAILRTTMGIKTAYADCYGVIQDAVNNPTKYGFEETSKGCCGTGTIEFGDSCKGLTTCTDPYKYAFWDAIHPTEKLYQVVADEALRSLHASVLH